MISLFRYNDDRVVSSNISILNVILTEVPGIELDIVNTLTNEEKDKIKTAINHCHCTNFHSSNEMKKLTLIWIINCSNAKQRIGFIEFCIIIILFLIQLCKSIFILHANHPKLSALQIDLLKKKKLKI